MRQLWLSVKGSEQEQNNFIYNRNSKEIDLEDANKKIKKRPLAYLILGCWRYSTNQFYILFCHKVQDAAVNLLTCLVTNLIIKLSYIYSFLACVEPEKPMAAIISGFALYVIILLLNAFTDPATIVSGIIIKIFFIGCFIKGIKSAIEAEKIKKELNIE